VELYIKPQKKQAHRQAHQLHNYSPGSSSASSASTVFTLGLFKNFLYVYVYFPMHFLCIIAVCFMFFSFCTLSRMTCLLFKKKKKRKKIKTTPCRVFKGKTSIFREGRKPQCMQNSAVKNT